MKNKNTSFKWDYYSKASNLVINSSDGLPTKMLEDKMNGVINRQDVPQFHLLYWKENDKKWTLD